MTPLAAADRTPRMIGWVRRLTVVIAASTVGVWAGSCAETPGGPTFDLVIAGGRVVDPESGLDALRHIGIAEGRVVSVSTTRLIGRRTIEATGLVVAPGFIDVHAHGQTPETYRLQSLDGVTSALELEVGAADIAAWYDARGDGRLINYGVSVGHIPVRMAVLGDTGAFLAVGPGARAPASEGQVREMIRRIEEGVSAGAVGIGAGFPYTPGATRAELLEVFRAARRRGVPVHAHIRRLAAGLREAIGLAEESGASLHVVHLNSAGLGETREMVRLITEARRRGLDITTEAYPYAAGMTEIRSANLDEYERASDDRLALLEWPPTGERLNRRTFDEYRKIGGPVAIHTNTDEMVAVAITSPLTMIASDAYWENGVGHPRTSGTFSRVLGRYVRETASMTLMDAVRKMTLMPAQRLERHVPAMRQKGRLREGADADVTVFDPATVIDRSTYRDPTLPPAGIQYVIVNGILVVDGGTSVEGVTPGRAIRGAQ